MKRAIEDLQIIAEAYEGQVYLFLDKLVQYTKGFASDRFIKTQLCRKTSVSNDSEQKVRTAKNNGAANILSRYLINNKLPLIKPITAINVLATDGRVVASTIKNEVGMNLSKEEFFLKGKNGTSLTDISTTHSGLPEIAISTPIYAKETLQNIPTDNQRGKLIGVLVNFVQVSRLNTLFPGEYVKPQEAIPLGKAGAWETMEIYLVNRDKRMITEFKITKTVDLCQIVNTRPVTMSLATGKEMTGFYANYRGAEVLGASMIIPSLEWTLLAEIDKDVALVSERGLFINAVITGFVVAVMLVLLFLVFVSKVVRPLRKISDAAQDMSRGNFDVAIPVAARDEIGMLCESFNSMSRQIMARTNTLVKSENALRRSEFQFRTVADFTWSWEFWMDISRRFIYISPSCERISGYTPAEFQASEKLFFSIAHPDDHHVLIRELEKAFSQCNKVSFDFRIIRKGGGLRWVSMSYQPITGDDESFLGVRGSLSDITQRRQMEDEMRKDHSFNEQMIVSIPSILILIDENDKIKLWNNAAETVFGITPADAIGKPLHTCGIQWEQADIISQILDCRYTTQPTRFNDVRFNNRVNKPGFLDISITSVLADTGKRSRLLIIGNDITQHKVLESQLVQSQKLEAIGQLAAGIAHEINTPTQYIGDNTHFLMDAFGDLRKLMGKFNALLKAIKDCTITDGLVQDVERAMEEAGVNYLTEEIPKAIQQSLEGVDRVAKIVLAMKEFSHPGSHEKSAIDINKAIENTITVSRNEWKYVADMVTDFDASIPLIPCLPGEFNQVILNIIVNAAHAIADVVGNGNKEARGVIKVSTKRHGKWAEVRIQDTGTGIPEAARSKIFDPFFTTKPIGKGTGQGLAIAHDIVVRKHGGTIDFETVIGKGTTFIIRIPTS